MGAVASVTESENAELRQKLLQETLNVVSSNSQSNSEKGIELDNRIIEVELEQFVIHKCE